MRSWPPRTDRRNPQAPCSAVERSSGSWLWTWPSRTFQQSAGLIGTFRDRCNRSDSHLQDIASSTGVGLSYEQACLTTPVCACKATQSEKWVRTSCARNTAKASVANTFACQTVANSQVRTLRAMNVVLSSRRSCPGNSSRASHCRAISTSPLRKACIRVEVALFVQHFAFKKTGALLLLITRSMTGTGVWATRLHHRCRRKRKHCNYWQLHLHKSRMKDPAQARRFPSRPCPTSTRNVTCHVGKVAVFPRSVTTVVVHKKRHTKNDQPPTLVFWRCCATKGALN